MILAIDVSARHGLLSLELPDGRLLTRLGGEPREQLAFLGEGLAGLRAEAGGDWAGLRRVAVTLGPGSFTGLRVGLAAAKGLVFGRDIPLAPLPSLALPRLAADPGLAAPALVSRRARADELWIARFAAGAWQPSEERLATLGELAEALATAALAGPAAAALQHVGEGPGAAPEPEAAAQLVALARLAREATELVGGPALDRLLPRYLLAPSVTLPGSGARRSAPDPEGAP
ncbi:tRNA (adenosine(37)-N6)-threonylcarbamoyltransferase complex dimerization subunit type 1 TsaB [bacterium]|nr:tRNA (adenosine(37)-N6)-threonylcarbamoyltransferase complex dimerization subunit type 1 TsaB [bacterium]